MNIDRLKYRYWQHTDWHDKNSPLEAVYCNAVDGCDPTIAVSDFEFCTGLKDKNGNLIYEGDIIKITLYTGNYDCVNEDIYKGTVIWERDCFLVKTNNLDMILFPHSEDSIEIISNIHEQPEQKD